MEHVLVVSPDRGRTLRVGRAARRLGYRVVQRAGMESVKPLLKEEQVAVLVLDAALKPGDGTLVLIRWVRRQHRQVGVILMGATIGKGLESSCDRLEVPCLREPIPGALLRACLRGVGSWETRGGVSTRQERQPIRTSGALRDEVLAHEVDDLWFDILERAARRGKRTLPK